MSTNETNHPGDRDEEAAVVWERQPSEGPKHYQAFCVYRELGARERSLSRVAKVLGYRGNSLLERWSSKYSWPARAEAYDDSIDEERRAEEKRNREAIARYRMAEIRNVHTIVMKRILGWDGDGDPALAVTPLDPNDLSARDIAALIRETNRMADRNYEKRNWINEELLRNLMITPREFTRATSDITELALRHIPDDRKPLFAEEIRAYANGDLELRQLRGT